MISTVLTVPGIHCDHCRTAIEGALVELDGVSSAEVSVSDRTVFIEFDETKVSLDTLKDTIIHQGYDVPA